MGWSCQRANGCVEAAPMSKPFCRAMCAMIERILTISKCASWIFRQTPVPISSMEPCISGLTCSWRTIRPFEISSMSMWERKSNVCGSSTMYSSSIPTVSDGGSFGLEAAKGAAKASVAFIVTCGNTFPCSEYTPGHLPFCTALRKF